MRWQWRLGPFMFGGQLFNLRVLIRDWLNKPTPEEAKAAKEFNDSWHKAMSFTPTIRWPESKQEGRRSA